MPDKTAPSHSKHPSPVSSSPTAPNILHEPDELIRSPTVVNAHHLTDASIPPTQRQTWARQLGQTVGNHQLQRMLHPVTSTPSLTIQRDGDITGVSTEFGSFDIYPDDFVGPLPVNARNATTWAIRQSDYDELNARLSAVRDGTSNITVVGTPTFKAQVYLDLGWLMTVSVGQELINQIQGARHSLTIQAAAGGNTTAYNPDADSYEQPMSPPTPGPGADVTIGYNPARLQIGDGTQPWHTRPPAIGLAHEMVHAWTGVYGMRALGQDSAGVNRRELQATGLGEFAVQRLHENRFRAAFGLPLRPTY